MLDTGLYTIQSAAPGSSSTWLTLRYKSGPITAEKWTGADNQKWFVRYTGQGWCTIENQMWSSSLGTPIYAYADAKLGAFAKGDDISVTWETRAVPVPVPVLGEENCRRYTITRYQGPDVWTFEEDCIRVQRTDPRDLRQQFHIQLVKP
ncbi:unnamed protein product [Rhizoctonia solani]|uniref:Uncharacterized protein n=1 Tax=Rhizoctonia solani TaxID=456999 RepID=A0A8H3I2X3_9AGAM|nr:unnamed protein product [Rhizoctonia solani]